MCHLLRLPPACSCSDAIGPLLPDKSTNICRAPPPYELRLQCESAAMKNRMTTNAASPSYPILGAAEFSTGSGSGLTINHEQVTSCAVCLGARTGDRRQPKGWTYLKGSLEPSEPPFTYSSSCHRTMNAREVIMAKRLPPASRMYLPAVLACPCGTHVAGFGFGDSRRLVLYRPRELTRLSYSYLLLRLVIRP
jgi:hypothetical protein